MSDSNAKRNLKMKKIKPRASPPPDGSLFGGSSWPCFVDGCPHKCHVKKDGSRPWFCPEHEALVREKEKAEKKAEVEHKKRPWRWPKLKKGEKRG